MHYQNKNAKQLDPTKSVQYYNTACFEQFEGVSCLFLASAYFDGTLFPKNVTKGNEMMQRACTTGYTSACLRIAEWNLSGDSRSKTKKNVAKGLEIMDRACTKARYEYACFDLEELMTTGTLDHNAKIKGIKKDRKQAAEYHAKGCALAPKSRQCK